MEHRDNNDRKPQWDFVVITGMILLFLSYLIGIFAGVIR